MYIVPYGSRIVSGETMKMKLVWGYATSKTAEFWHGASTKKQAMDCALEAMKDKGGTAEAWIRPGQFTNSVDFLPDFQEFSERLFDTASQNGCPDDVEDPFIFAKGAEKAFNKVLREWAKKYVKANWWESTGEAVQVFSKKKK
jgi:hypothetical protein